MNRKQTVVTMIEAYEKRTGNFQMSLDGMFGALEETGHRWHYDTLKRVLDSLERDGALVRFDHHVMAFGNTPMATWYAIRR